MDPTTEPDLRREDDRRAAARRYVRRLREFYQLLATAAAVIALTAVVNLMATPQRLWFPWVAFGFGIALVFSALRLFLRRRWLDGDWEQRKISAYLSRHG